VESFIFNIYLL